MPVSRAVRAQLRKAADRGTRAILLTLVSLAAGAVPLAARAQISLSTAVDLAEKSSPAVRSAEANVKKATEALAESQDAYIPNFALGASPGYAYGFPFGYPSLFSATSQSIVLSFPQRDYIRAARAGLDSARLSLKDQQQQVALDTAVAYVELDYDLKAIAALDEENSHATKLVSIEQDRVQAGVDPRVTELQAELTAAQVNLKRIQMQNDADAMRQKIAHLTGLPAAGFTTVSSSIPQAPTADSLASINDQSAPNDPGVAAAFANAKSKLYTSFGDARQNYRPLITFGAQYSLFEKFADYTRYFPTGFQYNNVAIGMAVQFPLFDAARRAKARESAADALHSQADADSALNILTEQRSSLQHSILELGAQQRVAEVQNQLAQEQLKTIETQLTNGTGTTGSQPITPREAEQAHIEERERYGDVLTTDFSLMKAELSLLRATGQIEDWVRSSLK